jgi:hypothetical protein
MSYNVEISYDNWLSAKEQERAATERRRAIEDEIISILEVPDTLDGTARFLSEHYTVKITGRIDRKVDADKVQEIAAEYGLTDHLAALFRWKPEINAAAWKAADASITGPLAGAITAKPGRPSISIVLKD